MTDWLTNFNKRAIKRFNSMDWPSSSEEEWRRAKLDHLNLDALVSEKAEPINNSIHINGKPLQVYKDANVSIYPLPYAIEKNIHNIRGLLENKLNNGLNRFEASHYSQLFSGVYLDCCLSMDNVHTVTLSGKNPHIYINVHEGAVATLVIILESFIEESLTNSVLEACLAGNSKLNLYLLHNFSNQSYHFHHSLVTLNQESYLDNCEVFLGGGFSKVKLVNDLISPNCEANIRGAYFAQNRQHIDVRSEQRHLAPDSFSRSLFKGVVQDNARTVYQGMIEVDETAKKTDAYLTNNNLILNNGARSDSIPSLKINTNDVRCSHGSTSGKINENHIFYLMSRGLSEKEARFMIVQGFFMELFTDTPEEFREMAMALITEKLWSR